MTDAAEDENNETFNAPNLSMIVPPTKKLIVSTVLYIKPFLKNIDLLSSFSLYFVAD